jgi:hypothetical protein
MIIKYRIEKDGTKIRYKSNKLHGLYSPAIEYPSGTRMWYQNGLLHRENGPSIEWFDGDKEWHIKNKEYTKEEYNSLVSK